jgi:signal transduction histidine kinase
VAACLLWFAGFAMAAQPPVQLVAGMAHLRIEPMLQWWHDPQSEAQLATLAQADGLAQFRPVGQGLSLGFLSGTVWLHAKLQTPQQEPQQGPQLWWLELGNPLFDDVRLYVRHADGRVSEQVAGEDQREASTSSDERKAVFRLAPGSDGQAVDIYIAIRSRNAISSTVTVWSPEAYQSAAQTEFFGYGAILGVYAFLVLFHLVFWRVSREAVSGWYVVWVTFHLLTTALSAGYLQLAAGMAGTVSDRLLGVLICMGIGITAQYASVFMALRQALPRFAAVFVTLGWSISSVLALAVLGGYYATGVATAQGLSLVYMVVLIGVAVQRASQGDRSARFFLLAFSVFWVAIALRYLRNLGVLPPGWITEHALPLASLLHIIVMSFGITGKYNQLRRQHFEAQQLLASSLETQVRARTVELEAEIVRRKASEEEARRALEVECETSETQRNFVAMVSHEFRTPLAIIDAVTQGLRRSLSAESIKDQGRCDDIRNATQRMHALLDEYLTLERMGNTMQAARTPCDVNALLDSVVREFASPRIQLLPCPDLGLFSMDATYVRLALRNLLNNGLRHSTDTSQVTLNARFDDTDLVLCVCDQGVGIPPDEVPRLFEKYFRGRQSQLQPGAGLGLYLVSQVAKMHAGRVEVAPASGQGTCFTLTLPHADGPAMQHQSSMRVVE